jgi:hypothetical protein
MKRIVIISRTIFPAINPRSFRATELSLELARQGHDVTLYAVLGNYDYSEYESEHKLKIRNIGRMFFAKFNSDGTQRRTLIDRILNKLLNSLLEFPDIELMFKIPKIIESEKNVDLLISIAIPYPIHWGCALSKSKTKQYFPKIWVADCGDPYMGNQFGSHFFYFKYLEKWFSKKADYLTVPSENIITFYYPEFRNKIKVIPQGFKFEDIDYSKVFYHNSVPTFAYVGDFYKNMRDPSLFLTYICSLEVKFKFVIYTKNDDLIRPYEKKLKDKIEVRSYITRKQLLSELSKMDFLLSIQNLNNYGSPSKLIDYTIVKRPILNISSNSLPIDTINEFFAGNYLNQFIVKNLEQYNISNVAKQFISLID